MSAEAKPPETSGEPRKGNAFTWRFTAPMADVDENEHISNVAYVRWLQDAARAHSDAVGFPRDAYIGLGGFFGVRRHEVDYLRPAVGGDPIEIVTWIEDMRPASATRVSTITRTSDGATLARAQTTWVWLSVDGGRPLRIPPALRAAFG